MISKFYFYSANGIHKNAYKILLNHINHSEIIPFEYPIGDRFPGVKGGPFRWTMFGDVIDKTIDTTGNIGIGHSSGATAILHHAILNPAAWKTIFIIEPALFSKSVNVMYKIVQFFRLEMMLHPMIRLTKKRRDFFLSKQDVLKRWRNYSTFQHFSDDALSDFVDASLTKVADGWTLRFPKAWEIQIYRSMCVLDPTIWNNIHKLQSKLIVIAGESSNTFLNGAQQRIKPYCTEFITLPSTTHLAPFEAPLECAKIINQHI